MRVPAKIFAFLPIKEVETKICVPQLTLKPATYTYIYLSKSPRATNLSSGSSGEPKDGPQSQKLVSLDS